MCLDVTFITYKLDIDGGGSNRSLDMIARQLTERGFSVRVVTIAPELNTLPSDLPYDVIEPSDKMSNRFGGAYRVYSVMNELEEETDLYHVFHPAFHSIAGYYDKMGGTVPIVGRLNGYAMFCTNVEMMDGECHKSCNTIDKYRHDQANTKEKLLRVPEYFFRTNVGFKLANRVDRLFALSPSVLKIHERKLETDFSVVPNFYDPEFATDEKAPIERSKPGNLRLLYVGRIVENKGVEMLLEALDDVDSEQITVDIVGDGPKKEVLERKADSLELKNVFTFHGWVPYEELPSYYASADLFVHPGKWPEPFGRTVLEALQCGTPGLVSDVGAPPWIVGDAGLTFESENANDLSENITMVLDDDNLLAEISGNTAARTECFSPSNVISKMVDEYHEVVG